MADELEEFEDEQVNKVEKRIKQLSEKVKLTSEERDELAKAKEEEAQLRQQVEKERDFYKGFNQVSTKYQGANEYQDQIFEKVKAGYDVEDATVSILVKEGKFKTETPKENNTAAGGSADTALADTGDKSPREMSQDERREALKALETQGQFHI